MHYSLKCLPAGRLYIIETCERLPFVLRFAFADYKLTSRRDLPWQGLNPPVRLIRFRPVGLLEPLIPFVPRSPWPEA
jgi:hypothetical protein